MLLNIYGGPGVTNVWTDDLEVFGHVPSGQDASVPAASPAWPIAASPAGFIGKQPLSPARRGHRPPPREVKLAGSVLKVNEYPIFPRCIEYRGEKLAFLKQLGFNTIWLRTDAVAGLPLRGPAAWPVAGLSAAGPELPAAGERPADDRAGIRARARLGPGARADRRVAGCHSAAGRAGAPGRFPCFAAADLRRSITCAATAGSNQPAADRSPAAGHEPGNAQLRQLGPPATAVGPARHSGLDHGANPGGRGPAAAVRHAHAGPGAAHGRRPRADPAAGLHGHLLRKSRPAVPFRLLAGGPGRRNAAAGDDARNC